MGKMENLRVVRLFLGQRRGFDEVRKEGREGDFVIGCFVGRM